LVSSGSVEEHILEVAARKKRFADSAITGEWDTRTYIHILWAWPDDCGDASVRGNHKPETRLAFVRTHIRRRLL
jgi:hypothetical protein